MDNQLPVALARWLGAQGADAVHVLDLCLDSTPDTDIWACSWPRKGTPRRKTPSAALKRTISASLVPQPCQKSRLPVSSAMPTLAKSATLGTLGLPAGDHLVHFQVEADTISFEVTTSQPASIKLDSMSINKSGSSSMIRMRLPLKG